MEHGNTPERAIDAMHRGTLMQKIADLCQEFDPTPDLSSERPLRGSLADITQPRVFDITTENFQTYFYVDGAYVSLERNRETRTFDNSALTPTEDTVVNMQVATPLLFDGAIYWSVERYYVDKFTGRYDDLLYSDKPTAKGLWTQFMPRFSYDKEDRAAREARTTLTSSHYQRATAILKKLNESNNQTAVPEIFSQESFDIELM